MRECNPVLPTSPYKDLIDDFLSSGGVVKKLAPWEESGQIKNDPVTPKQMQVLDIIRERQPITRQDIELQMGRRIAVEVSALMQRSLIKDDGCIVVKKTKRMLLVTVESPMLLVTANPE